MTSEYSPAEHQGESLAEDWNSELQQLESDRDASLRDTQANSHSENSQSDISKPSGGLEPEVASPQGFSIPYLVTAVAATGYGFVVSLFAEFRDEYGFGGWSLGFLTAAGFFAGFVTQVWLSHHADKGRGQQMIRFGLLAGVIAALWMAVSSDIYQFVAARVLLGLGAGLCGPPIRKIIISRDPKNMGKNLGKISAVDVFGFTLGPVMAAVIASFAGLRVPFLVLATLFASVLLLVWKEDLNSSVTKSERSEGGIRLLLGIPGVQGTLAASVAFYGSIGVYEVSWAQLLDDNGASTWLVGIGFGLFVVPMVIFAPLGGRVTQKKGALKVIVWSVALATLCVLSYGWFDILWLLLAISAVHAVADAFTLPGLQVGIAASSPEEHQATGQGLMGGTGLVIAGVIGLAGGPIYDYGGPEMLFSLGALVMITSLIFAIYRSLDPSVRSAATGH